MRIKTLPVAKHHLFNGLLIVSTSSQDRSQLRVIGNRVDLSGSALCASLSIGVASDRGMAGVTCHLANRMIYMIGEMHRGDGLAMNYPPQTDYNWKCCVNRVSSELNFIHFQTP